MQRRLGDKRANSLPEARDITGQCRHSGNSTTVSPSSAGTSGSGVCFTRDPSTGEPGAYGNYLTDAQGEDVVNGSRDAKTLDHLAEGVTVGGADAVLAASIFHFGEHTVAEAKAVLAAAGIAIRPA